MGLLPQIPPDLLNLLTLAAGAAGAADSRLWLVGGVVRDLLLGRPLTRDLDLAVEGDVVALAASIAAAAGGRVVAAHPPFGTATVEAPGLGGQPLVLDLARARSERYRRPAALPEVTPAPIEDDLIRRDFSVNAMALGLHIQNGMLRDGPLLDPFGGQADLAAGLLRLLHTHSLRDDPTRILRGLRLAARLSMAPEPASAAQIAEARAAGYLALLTPERILGELCLSLDEPRPDEVLRLSDQWEVTPQIVPGLAWNNESTARTDRLVADTGATAIQQGSLVRAGLLLYNVEESSLAALAARYPLPSAATALLRQIPPLRRLAATLPNLPNSALDQALRPFSAEAISVLHYAEPAAAVAAARYLCELRPARAPLDGNDLRRLGVAPGPTLGRLLDELRAAFLDDQITTRAAAEHWVRERLKQASPRSRPE